MGAKRKEEGGVKTQMSAKEIWKEHWDKVYDTLWEKCETLFRDGMGELIVANPKDMRCVGTDGKEYTLQIAPWEIEEDQEEEPESDGWIPCEDRLPDEIGVYLVSGRMKYDTDKEYEYFVDFADYHYDYKGKFGGYFGTYNDWYEGQHEYEILAWQPLPEPLRI